MTIIISSFIIIIISIIINSKFNRSRYTSMEHYLTPSSQLHCSLATGPCHHLNLGAELGPEERPRKLIRILGTCGNALV